jgi:hypothetical protein
MTARCRKAVTATVASGLALLATPARAQRAFGVGVRAGTSIPDLRASSSDQNPVSTGYGSRLGPDGGIFVEASCSNTLSVEAMVEWSAQGGRKDGLQALVTPDALAALFPSGQTPPYLYADFTSEAKLNYVLVPLLAKVGHRIADSPWRVHVDAGPFVGFLTSATQVTSGTSVFYLDSSGHAPLGPTPQSLNASDDIADQLRRLNVGIEGGVGLTYRTGRHAVTVEGGGNFGFVKIQKEATNGANRTGAANLVAEYTYWLGQ